MFNFATTSLILLQLLASTTALPLYPTMLRGRLVNVNHVPRAAYDDGSWNPTKYDGPGAGAGPTTASPPDNTPSAITTSITPTPTPQTPPPNGGGGGGGGGGGRNNLPGTKSIIYTINGLPPPESLAGFNVLMLSFWTTSGSAGDAATWTQMSLHERRALLDAYHAAGVKVMVAAFGANDNPTAADPATVASQLVDYVNAYEVDGIDLDYEDTAALLEGNGVNWVSSLTRLLRQQLPNTIISHAPQSAYWGAGGYHQVHAQVGDMIDFYNTQYYNQGGDQGCEASLANVRELLAAGIPGDKIVFGKPLHPPPEDSNDGYMSPQEIKQCFASGPDGWSRSVMWWKWHEDAAQILATVRS